jgi:hypothetical protein
LVKLLFGILANDNTVAMGLATLKRTECSKLVLHGENRAAAEVINFSFCLTCL